MRLNRLHASALIVVASLGLMLVPAGAARANGVPQLVKLTYVQGVSNFGPQDAEGVLEFSFAEAYARVDVKGLKPEPGYSYEGWLIAPGGDSLKVGPIALGPDGVGFLDTRLEKLQSYEYRTFVVAARGPAAQGTGMPTELSIAGVFEVLGSEPAGSARGDLRPGVLPDTGEAVPLSTMTRIVRAGGAATLMTVVTAAALVIIRRRRAQS
jgi:hypothetical protein